MADEITPAPERTAEDALNDALGYTPEPDPEPTPAADPEPTPEPDPEPPKYTVAGKGYKDEDELVKALEHANTLISQRPAETPPPVVEEPEELDPWEHIPGIPQERKNDLYKHAQENPLEAGKWAWENRENLPREIWSQVVAFAQANDSAGWEEYRYDLSVKAAERIAGEATQRFAVNEQQAVAKSAEATLRGELGASYDTYEPLINARITAGQYVAPPAGLSTEDAVLHVFRQVYKDIWVDQNWASLQAVLNPDPIAAATGSQPAPPAPAPAPTPPPAPPVTAAPGAAAPAPPPAGSDEEMHAAIQRALGI